MNSDNIDWFPTFHHWLSGAAFPLYTTRTQADSLLRIIVVSIEQQLPLAPLLRAFADDQTGAQRNRIHRLANLLESGTGLPDAVEQIPGILSAEGVLSIRFGSQSGTLAQTLRGVLDQSEDADHVSLLELKRRLLVYPVTVIIVAVLILTFLMRVIVPKYERIMWEFDLPKSDLGVFEFLIAVSQSVSVYWIPILAGVLCGFLAFWSENPGRSLRRAFVRPWFDTRSADVLKSLSTVAAAGRPISGAISTLARYHHDPALRRALLFVRNETEHGADVWESLAKVKLISPTEVALMAVSEKVGNRPWVMAQLAAAKRRRLRHRLELVGAVAEPLSIVVLACLVFLICLAFLSPLVQLVLYCA